MFYNLFPRVMFGTTSNYDQIYNQDKAHLAQDLDVYEY